MIPLPEWVEEIQNPLTKQFVKQRFMLRLAALYATEAGTLSALAYSIGVNNSTLKSQSIGVCRASRKTWIGIHNVLGNDFVPPDFRRPNGSDGRR